MLFPIILTISFITVQICFGDDEFFCLGSPRFIRRQGTITFDEWHDLPPSDIDRARYPRKFGVILDFALSLYMSTSFYLPLFWMQNQDCQFHTYQQTKN